MYFVRISKATHFIIIVLTSLLVMSCGEFPQKTAVDPLATTAHDYMAQVIADKKISGAVALLARGDEVIFYEAQGMADDQLGRPMTKDTLFRIASMSKPITSVAIMMLYEDGLLNLDDPVSKYIPEFSPEYVLDGDGSRNSHLSTGPITIHHLLTHTSGITYKFMGPDILSKIYEEAGVKDGLTQNYETTAEAIKRLAKLPLSYEPGTKWTYSLSTDVLGYLIEVVSGKPMDEFYRTRIFTPFKMTDTGFFLSPEQASHLAAVYVSKEGGGIEKLGEAPIKQGYGSFSTSFPYDAKQRYASGGAGLVSTVGDYYRFMRMLINGGTLDGVRYLKEETVHQMHQNQIGDLTLGNGKEKFGFGFSVNMVEEGFGGLGTYGWAGFFHTKFWIDPKENLSGIFMSQLRPLKGGGVTKGFIKAIYKTVPKE